ncbi:MAG: GerW family sporulation protein [Oscillospiraceae bacterium]|nr:GerW family sporulation protein [Oscillospiraceae bacterium]
MSNEVKKPETGSLIRVLEFTVDKAMSLANANAVLGEKMEIDGVTVIPVSKLSVGFAGGGADITDVAKKKKQNPAGAGAQVTLTPLSFLVIQEGQAQVLTVQAEPKPSLSQDLLAAVAQQAKGLFKKGKK